MFDHLVNLAGKSDALGHLTELAPKSKTRPINTYFFLFCLTASDNAMNFNKIYGKKRKKCSQFIKSSRIKHYFVDSMIKYEFNEGWISELKYLWKPILCSIERKELRESTIRCWTLKILLNWIPEGIHIGFSLVTNLTNSMLWKNTMVKRLTSSFIIHAH